MCKRKKLEWKVLLIMKASCEIWLLTPNYCWRPHLRDPKAWSDQKAEKIFLQVGFVCWHVQLQVVVKLNFSCKAFSIDISSCFNVMLHDQKAEKKYFCKLGLFVDMFSPSGIETWFSCKAFAVDISSWFNIVVLKLHILFSRIITANFKGFLHFFT